MGQTGNRAFLGLEALVSETGGGERPCLTLVSETGVGNRVELADLRLFFRMLIGYLFEGIDSGMMIREDFGRLKDQCKLKSAAKGSYQVR